MPLAPPDAGTGIRRAHRFWYALLPISLAAFLLYLALRDADWYRVWTVVSSVRPEFLVAACLISSLSYFLRSLRWRVLLNAQARLGMAPIFWATMAGYLGNSLLPARAGELVRTFLVSARFGLTKTFVLTTALTERLVDAIVLVAVGSAMLARTNKAPDWLANSAAGASFVAAAGLAVLLALPRAGNLLDRILSVFPLPLKLHARLREMVQQVALGLGTLHHRGRLAKFAAFTAAIWALDAAGSVIAARALSLNLSFPVAFLLLAGLGLGSALPSTPGYVGIYQFVAVTVLTLFGFTRSDALAYILVAQFFNYVVVGTFGVAGLLRARPLLAAGERPSEAVRQ
jgi:uncharacterized protein (TIRG00374 family)